MQETTEEDNPVSGFECFNCEKSLYGHRFVKKLTRSYCLNCYNLKFGNTCRSCNKLISADNKDLLFCGSHWHEFCFKCSQCKELLSDNGFAEKNGKLYCSECWNSHFATVCEDCSKPFVVGNMKLTWNGGHWHRECFKCSACRSMIGLDAFHPSEGSKILCKACWVDKFSVRCTHCKEAICSGGITFNQLPYHRECFTCQKCCVPILGGKFTRVQNQPMCASCYLKDYAKNCFHCQQTIHGVGGARYITFENNYWHCGCFNCSICHESIVGKSFVADGFDQSMKVYCHKCGFQRKQAVSDHLTKFLASTASEEAVKDRQSILS